MSGQPVHAHWITSAGREGGSGPGGALFPFWSFTKTAIAICALKLVELRDLDLDAPSSGHPCTLRQFLAHTSGLPDYGTLREYRAAVARGDTPWPRERLLDAALEQERPFQPGQGWSYSNVGYVLIREAIEQATGRPLGDVIADLVCAPLGLNATMLWETRDQSEALHREVARDYDPRWVYHGCLCGPASEAARLLQALLAGDLLKPDTLGQMLDREIVGGPLPGRPWTLCGYGLGLMSGSMGAAGTAIGHSGSGPFSVSAVYHFPDRADPVTVACFVSGTNAGVAEHEAARIACTL